MRLQKRNRRKIYFALYEDKTPILDEYDNETGEYEVEYSDPFALEANVSPATGESSTRQFGLLADYDKVVLTCDMTCPIDESSILWIDTDDTSGPHDYIVKRVAKSLNCIAYAVKKVKVSG